MGEIIKFDTKLENARKLPPQMQIMGDYVRSGELTTLFAGTSHGKSILSMTIAIGYCSGAKTILGENNDYAGVPQKCLYVDVEMSDTQLLNRYDGAGAIPNLYSIDYDSFVNRKSLDARINRNDLNKWIDETGATLVVLDNLGAIVQDAQSPNETKELAFMLRQFCRERGVTVLVVAHSTKCVFSGKPQLVTLATLEGSYKWSGYNDHILGIGKTAEGETYLRHLKSRNGQPQDILKLIQIERDPFIYFTSGETVPASELFPTEDFNESTSKNRGIDYVQLALDVFSEKSQFRYKELMDRISEITDCKESMAKYYITQMKAKNAIVQDGKNFIVNRNETGYNAITEGEGYIPLDAKIVEIDLF